MKNYLIIIFLVLLDQITKFIFTNKHFGIINYAENTGAGFSLLQGYNGLLIWISIFVLIFVIYNYNSIKWKLPLLFIISGILGNLTDRIIFGFVRDFIDLKVWPIFNLADSFNVIGVCLLIYLSTRNKKI